MSFWVSFSSGTLRKLRPMSGNTDFHLKLPAKCSSTPFVRLIVAGSEAETRDAAVGFTEDSRLLFVVHLIREQERIRIISARAATAREREEYESE